MSNPILEIFPRQLPATPPPDVIASVDLDMALGTFDVQTLAARATEMMGTKIFVASGLFITLAILVRTLKTWWLWYNEQPPQWLANLGAVAFWTCVAACFQQWSSDLMYYITHIAGPPSDWYAIKALCLERMTALSDYRKSLSPSFLGAQSLDSIAMYVLRLVTAATFVFIEIVAYILRQSQAVALGLLLAMGQMVACLSALGGAFANVGFGWLMLFIEICMWSPVLRIMLTFFSEYGKKLPNGDEYSLTLELVVCCVLIYFIKNVPRWAGMLVQGGGGGWLAPSGGLVAAASMAAAATTLGTKGFAAGALGGQKQFSVFTAAKDLFNVARGASGGGVSQDAANKAAEKYLSSKQGRD